MVNQKSVTGKEPWLAVILSTLFPGVGQIYADDFLKFSDLRKKIAQLQKTI